MECFADRQQAQLKQREGEIVQLQMEVSGLERVRESLTQELGRLTQKTEELTQVQEELTRIKHVYVETEKKYQTMLTVMPAPFSLSLSLSIYLSLSLLAPITTSLPISPPSFFLKNSAPHSSSFLNPLSLFLSPLSHS